MNIRNCGVLKSSENFVVIQERIKYLPQTIVFSFFFIETISFKAFEPVLFCMHPYILMKSYQVIWITVTSLLTLTE